MVIRIHIMDGEAKMSIFIQGNDALKTDDVLWRLMYVIIF